MNKKSFSLLVLLSITTCLYSATLEQLQAEGVGYVDFIFSDPLGNPHELCIPMKHLPAAFERGLYFDGSSTRYTAISNSDMLLLPTQDRDVHLVPWFEGNKKVARVICDVHVDETTPYTGDPRYILQEIVDEAAQMGLGFYVGPELEFFLFKKDSLETCNTSGYFDIEENITMESHLKTLMSALQEHGINIEKLHKEVASGQFEMSLRFTNPLIQADRIVLAKRIIKEWAQHIDLTASFMPKPKAGQNGSGMHIHFSVYDLNTGENLFFDADDKNKLSETAYHFMAGVLAHLKELCVLFNPSINSFKRLVPGYEAPIYICWGKKNRSAAIRIPVFSPERPESARAELRCGDPSCNPYLAFAGLLKAGLDGIKNKREITDAVEQSLYLMSPEALRINGISTLPSSLEEAVRLFKYSTIAQELCGDLLFNKLVELKEDELADFRSAVTNWEQERYF